MCLCIYVLLERVKQVLANVVLRQARLRQLPVHHARPDPILLPQVAVWTYYYYEAWFNQCRCFQIDARRRKLDIYSRSWYLPRFVQNMDIRGTWRAVFKPLLHLKPTFWQPFSHSQFYGPQLPLLTAVRSLQVPYNINWLPQAINVLPFRMKQGFRMARESGILNLRNRIVFM